MLCLSIRDEIEVTQRPVLPVRPVLNIQTKRKLTCHECCYSCLLTCDCIYDSVCLCVCVCAFVRASVQQKAVCEYRLSRFDPENNGIRSELAS